MQLNHRGQTLVLFVLLLPVLLLVLGFLIDIGHLHIEKRKVDHAITNALEYVMEHRESSTLETDIYKLLVLNLKTIENAEIHITEDQITISVTKTVNSIFPFLYQEKDTVITMKKSILENKRIIKE